MKELFLTPNTDSEIAVRQAVDAFYAAFNDGFVGACEFADENWDHINPGIRTFVVVKRGDRWRVMQDQNTTISRVYV